MAGVWRFAPAANLQVANLKKTLRMSRFGDLETWLLCVFACFRTNFPFQTIPKLGPTLHPSHMPCPPWRDSAEPRFQKLRAARSRNSALKFVEIWISRKDRLRPPTGPQKIAETIELKPGAREFAPGSLGVQKMETPATDWLPFESTSSKGRAP